MWTKAQGFQQQWPGREVLGTIGSGRQPETKGEAGLTGATGDMGCWGGCPGTAPRNTALEAGAAAAQWRLRGGDATRLLKAGPTLHLPPLLAQWGPLPRNRQTLKIHNDHSGHLCDDFSGGCELQGAMVVWGQCKEGWVRGLGCWSFLPLENILN